MKPGDVQIYDKPAFSLWRSPVLWVIMMISMIGAGAYILPSLG